MRKPDSKWFKMRAEKSGYSLRSLAAELTLDHSALSRVIHGKRALTFREACLLADRLKVTLNEIAKRMRY